MKRIFLLWVITIMTLPIAYAQNLKQDAIVKTRGRLQDDGSVVAGYRISDAVVEIKNGATIFSDESGELTFTVPSNKGYYIKRVAKAGYTLSDIDILAKEQKYSTVAIDILLEDSEELKRYRRAIESKVRRNYQHQINIMQSKIDSLETAGVASDEELSRLYSEIETAWDLSESYIDEMTDRYLLIDFDREDAFGRQMSAYILNGELDKADSMLAAKGDLVERANRSILAQQAVEADKQDVAKDCYSKYEIASQRLQRDSAAYYLELRTALDRTNIDWQVEAGLYISVYLADYDRALSIYQPTLEYCLEHYGELSEKTALLYNNIGLVYRHQGLYDKALEYNLKALEICEKVLGKEHTDTATSYNNIGGVYDVQGLYDQALEYYLKALGICEKVLGKEHPNTATSYNNIGLVYRHQGLYDKALEYNLKALEICEKVLGKEHPNTATSYNNIGLVYQHQGLYDKALEYYFKALAIFEKVLGKEHPDTAILYNNIGLVYQHQGLYDKALEYYFKALAIFEKVLGKEHPDTAILYNNIGLVYQYQGLYDQALEYYFKALEIFEKVLGKEHPSTATSYDNIGSVYDDQGLYDKALEYYFKALAIREKVLGKEHTDTATSYNNIGLVYQHQGLYDKALEYYFKPLAIFEKALGTEHPYTISVSNDIEYIKSQMGK